MNERLNLSPQVCGKCNLSQDPKLFYCRDCGEPLVIGKAAGRFRIVQRIASGGMSVIYLAQDPATKETAAVKVLNQQNATNSDTCQRFLREAQAIDALRHPHIVKLEAYGEIDRFGPYIALEFLQGQPLSALLHEGHPFPLRRLFPFLDQLSSAMTFAHDQGVVHRDLKPENLYLLPRAQGDLLKVFDFGIAKFRHGSALTEPGKILGTPYYMSPEQAMGRPVDHRADIYALGVLLFQLLSGSLPFQARNPMELLSLRLFQDAPLLSQKRPALAGSHLEALIVSCLKREPQERLDSIRTFSTRLQEARRSDAALLRILQEAEDIEAEEVESTQKLPLEESLALAKEFSDKRSLREIEMVETFDGSVASPFASAPPKRGSVSSATLSITPSVSLDPHKKPKGT